MKSTRIQTSVVAFGIARLTTISVNAFSNRLIECLTGWTVTSVINAHGTIQ